MKGGTWLSWFSILTFLSAEVKVGWARRLKYYNDDSPATQKWEEAMKILSIRCATLARMVATEISGDPDKDCETLRAPDFEEKIEFACYYEEYKILVGAICGGGSRLRIDYAVMTSLIAFVVIVYSHISR